MSLVKTSPCKVNLLLNILGKHPDGFHELETLIYPINYTDELTFAGTARGIELTCNLKTLPTDQGNLVHRAASAFFQAARITKGIRIHLEKKIPLAAGLGGGSANAAVTLLALNELFGEPLAQPELHQIAASLGSDLPFFLQGKPAIATGRGEKIQSLDFFDVLKGAAFLLLHPGFGISTPWAYQQMIRFPTALNGRSGRAHQLIHLLQSGDLPAAGREFFNSLEAPALDKYPILAIYQDFLRAHGAHGTLMSGSGSTTFGLFPSEELARDVQDKVLQKFGPCWSAVVPA